MADIEINPIPKPIAISTAVTSTDTATDPNTIVVNGTHGFENNETVNILGVTGMSIDAENEPVTVLDGTSLTISQFDTGTYAGGGKIWTEREFIARQPALSNGPFLYSDGYIYSLFRHNNTITGTDTVVSNAAEMWQIDPDDPANGRVLLDEANSPNSSYGVPDPLDAVPFSCAVHGTFIEAIGQKTTGTSTPDREYVHYRFDLANGTWSNSGTGVQTGLFQDDPTSGVGGRTCFIAVDSSSNIHMIYDGLSETVGTGTINYSRVYYGTYNGTTWSEIGVLFGSSAETNYFPLGIVYDTTSNIMHAFASRARATSQDWNSQRDLIYIGVSGTNTSSEVTISDKSTVFSHAIGYNDGSFKIAMPIVTGTATSTSTSGNPAHHALRVLYANSTSTEPAFSTDVVTTDTRYLPGILSRGGNAGAGCLAWQDTGDLLHLFWGAGQNLVTGTASENASEIYRSYKSSGSWQTPVLFKSGKGQTNNWDSWTSIDETTLDPGPIWYTYPQIVVDGTNVSVIYCKFFQYQINDGYTTGQLLPIQTEFPHIDSVEICVCAGGTSVGNYAYLS